MGTPSRVNFKDDLPRTDMNGYCRCFGDVLGFILRFQAIHSERPISVPCLVRGSRHRRNGHPRRDER